MSHDVQNSYSTILKYTAIHEHAWLALRTQLAVFLFSILGVFGVLWTLSEATSYFLKIDLTGAKPYISMALLSLMAALVYTGYRYVHTVPNGFKSESRMIQRLAHLKRPRWEYRLGLSLLRDRLSSTDQKLSELLAGRRYVPISRKLEPSEYMKWLTMRPTNLLKMVAVAKTLLVFDLPNAMMARDNSDVYLQQILQSVERIDQFYQQIYEFELEGFSIEPPEGFEKIHQIQNGWTQVIRGGVHQMFDFLQQILDADLKKKNASVAFTITIEAPVGLREFEEELDRLGVGQQGVRRGRP